MHILIAGDSFAANWLVKYPNLYPGWPNLIESDYSVTNLAQAGCSEYKILKQLQSVTLTDFDMVIISHTSPDRVHTICHPIHQEDLLHRHSDLIFSDIEYHWHKHSNNCSLAGAYYYFKYHYDKQYNSDMYLLLREKIDKLLQGVTNLQITHFEDVNAEINFSEVNKSNPGVINHYSEVGNVLVYNTLKEIIEEYHGKTI